MLLRHIDRQRQYLTLAAIDAFITCGRWSNGAELRRSVLAAQAALDKAARVCRTRIQWLRAVG